MKGHKGQSVVEFALVLPLFLFIMFGIIYTGMMFHDYSTLSNIARACTREAAVSATDNYTKIETDYTGYLNGLMTSFYKPVGSKPITIKQDGDVIQTTINMKLNVSGFLIEMIVPRTFGIRYYMRKEPITPTL